MHPLDPSKPSTPLSAGPSAGQSATGPKEGDAKAIAKDFEATFLQQAVGEMMKTVKMGGLDGGHGEEMWKSFLARGIADEIAASGRTGIAQSVERMIRAYGSNGGEHG
ncbi:rod-binding protein [Thioclava atlantica]|uniref:Chemotactic signal-response protein CheL n=1 Tax=Thioclava atlantica TaxID=1317124 RepID=A0A085TY95_9RHOB|nr:rod-binding protein [Thioclava atlantica]KFE35692.1 chemotactic signal-response protein CheL [Thioclava atlantica]